MYVALLSHGLEAMSGYLSSQRSTLTHTSHTVCPATLSSPPSSSQAALRQGVMPEELAHHPSVRGAFTHPPTAVTVCSNMMRSVREVRNVFRHEATHAVDVCDATPARLAAIRWTSHTSMLTRAHTRLLASAAIHPQHTIHGADLRVCGELACSEVRASARAECSSGLFEWGKRSCTRQRAVASTNLVFPGQGAACVDTVFQACYGSVLGQRPPWRACEHTPDDDPPR